MSSINFKQQLINELYSPARRNFLRRRVEIRSLYDLYAGDLIEMKKNPKLNKNFTYILVVINCFSKMLYTRPLKSKTGTEVAHALDNIFTTARPPKNFQTDDGTEFFNTHCEKIYRKHGINHYSTYSVIKSGIVERVNRTLKQLLYRQFAQQGSYKFLDILPTVTAQYNHTVHRTTKFKPIDVNEENEYAVLKNILRNTAPKINFNRLMIDKFKKGDYVRVSKYKNLFEKSYEQNWTNEVFKIRDVVKFSHPTTYLLEAMNGELIEGAFYAEELSKVANPDVHLIEKIVQRKGNRVRVKWLGLPTSENSWIDKKDVI
jgi:hypothetical protein